MQIDGYKKTYRTVKYALLFIGITFMSFFAIEVLNKKLIHPVQYILIGLALVLFYTLLLSLSEHISFGYSYLIAVSCIVLMITAYTKSVLKSNLISSAISGLLSILYGFLYVLLQLEDYALLLGSAGLFVILGMFMYLTRRINWYTVMNADNVTNRIY